jgi:hypothetical protein
MLGQNDVFEKMEAELLRKHQLQMQQLRRLHGIGNQKNTILSPEKKSRTYSRLKLHEGFDVNKHRILCKGEEGAPVGSPARFKPYGSAGLKTCCKKRNCHLYFSMDDIEAIRYRVHVPKPDSGEFKQRIDDVKLKYMLLDDKPCCMSFLLNAIGHSRDKYYHTTYKSVDRRSEVDVSILSWFVALIPMLDCIPNPAIPPESDISDFSDHRMSPMERKKTLTDSKKGHTQDMNHNIWRHVEEYQV